MNDEKVAYKTAKAFFEDYSKREAELLFEGFLEKDEDPNVVRFAPNGDCSNWIKLPMGAIKEVEVLRRSEWCYTEKDGHHVHPYVRISVDISNGAAAQSIARMGYILASRKPQRVHATNEPRGRDLFRQLVQRKNSRLGSIRPGAVDCPDGWDCEYHEDLCPPWHCVCVNYKLESAHCSNCCVA